MPPRTVPLLLTLTFLLSCLFVPAQTKTFKYGNRISGKRLTGPSAIEERHVHGPMQCLILCAQVANCTALNFNNVSDIINCHLFEERACPGHQLVSDPAVNYYDVYDQPPTMEHQLFSWVDGSCSNPNMTPPGAYRCSNGTCQTTEGFWEIRPGFALPRMMNISLHPSVQTYKKLKNGTCSLAVNLKLGVGAHVDFDLVGTQQEVKNSLKFRIRLTATDLLYYNTEGTELQIVSGADTTGMVNSNTFTHLKISWCGGAMTLGPADDPTLVSGQVNEAGEVDEIVYLAGISSGQESYFQVDSGAADSWLFDEEGTVPDPVFSFGDSMITKRIEPTVDVTVRYDCRADGYCGVYFHSLYPHMLTVYVGGWQNSACAIAYHFSSGPYFLKHVTGSVLSLTKFNTFTVRYNNGSVTVFRNDGVEPIYNVTAPILLPPITSVGIGSVHWGSWKSVRVARYDPAWRTDTWKTHGTGFSNMDMKLYSP